VNREEYSRRWSTGHARDHGRPTIVPEDIQRVEHHTPCFMCGTARGCKHRLAA
jgi:hypothetical protein